MAPRVLPAAMMMMLRMIMGVPGRELQVRPGPRPAAGSVVVLPKAAGAAPGAAGSGVLGSAGAAHGRVGRELGEAAGGDALGAKDEGFVAGDGLVRQSRAGVGGSGLDGGLREGLVETGLAAAAVGGVVLGEGAAGLGVG